MSGLKTVIGCWTGGVENPGSSGCERHLDKGCVGNKCSTGRSHTMWGKCSTKDAPFTVVCLSNVNLCGKLGPRQDPWSCSGVSGAAFKVSPSPCSELTCVPQSASCATYS
ncbi:hypothetical protein NL676_010052 [Syzygium grande]|nr:hypothetical protein NL676_010052 [Syzygium grande]